MEALKDEVVSTIRGVLVSTKGSLDVRRLQKDYRMIIGEDIPYRKLGYNSLEDFLNDVPTLRVRNLYNGEILIDAVATTQSKHISQLVDRQKTSKKKFSYSSNKYKTSPSRFAATRYKKPFSNGNPRAFSRPFNPKPSFRRHSDFNPNHKPSVEKRRSVFDRLGPRVAPEESDSYDEYYEEDEEEVVVVQSVISDRLQKYRNNKQVNGSDQESSEDESPTRPFRNPYPTEINKEEVPTPSTSTKSDPPSRLKDILNKISDLKLNSVENKSPSPPFEKENQISGPTNRMNDILHKVSELKSKESASHKFEENIPNEDINPRRYSMPAFGMQPPVFSVPDIDRPRMRSQPTSFSNLPSRPNLPAPSNFQVRPPFPSNPIRSSVQSRLQQHRNFSIPSISAKNQEIKNEDSPISFASQQIPKYEQRKSPQELASPTILEETTNIKENCFVPSYRNNIPRFQNKIKTPEEKLSPVDNFAYVTKDAKVEKENVTPLSSSIQGEQQGSQIPVISGNRPNKEEYCDKILLTSPEDTWELLKKGTIIQVTCAISPIKIWCRLLNSSSAEIFDQLMYLLGVEYSNGSHFTSHFFVGGYFVAYFEGCWYRVRVLEVLENDCRCFLIDHGDEVITPQNDLRKLLKQFAHIPAQAVMCSLADLEEHVSCAKLLPKLQELVEHRYFAVKKDSCHAFSIDLYEITQNGKQDISLNQLLLKQIIGESVVTTLEEDCLYKGYITHVEPKGFIYVRVESEGLQKFFQLLTSLSENEAVLRSVEHPVEEEVYLQKNIHSRLFERCKIIDQDPNRRYAQFLFIDSGRIAISRLVDITLYYIDSQIINAYPPLAIKVKLDLDEVPEYFPDKIQYLTEHYAQNSLRTIRLLRFEQNQEETTAVCDIFMQAEYGKSLISLKAVLLSSLKKIEEPSHTEEIEALPAHSRPEIDSFLDAKVVFSISPSHFYVQLYDYAQQFRELMKKLQDRYNKLSKTERHTQNIKVGKIYALKYTDCIWYRVQVIKINTNHLHIFFSDFGYEIDVPIDTLYHLESQFYELPHQAVKMKIFGIKPKFGEWSEEDCDYFNNLVSSKAFVFQVKKVENSVYLEITAEIFDTSQEEDVNIGQFLVAVNLAVFAR